MQILILAEGPTEETFLREVLAFHLHDFGVFIEATIITTKRIIHGPNFKGGVSTYAKIKSELKRLLEGKRDVVVTTMLDFYALPSDSPGLDSLPSGDCFAKVKHVERAIENDIGDSRVKIFLTLHEFEAFAFVDPSLLLQIYPDEQIAVGRLQAIRNQYDTPEQINLGEETAPSKRLAANLRRYAKPIDGPSLAVELGVPLLKKSCPHFREWVEWLEACEVGTL